jgi:hypothetical protein
MLPPVPPEDNVAGAATPVVLVVFSSDLIETLLFSFYPVEITDGSR